MKLSVEDSARLLLRSIWDEAKPVLARKYARPLRNTQKAFETIQVVREAASGVDTVLAHAQSLIAEAVHGERRR